MGKKKSLLDLTWKEFRDAGDGELGFGDPGPKWQKWRDSRNVGFGEGLNRLYDALAEKFGDDDDD